MPEQGDSRPGQDPERSPSGPAGPQPRGWWNEATLLAELGEQQERLVFDMLSRAQQSCEAAQLRSAFHVVEAENVRLARELAGSVDRLQEVHHRVRNHLQAITGLLSAEEVAVDSESARRALRDSIARLTSIAAIHDLLARDPHSGELRLGDLVARLSQHLLAQAGAQERVRVRTQVTEVKLDSKRVTALVLILTELLSNAIAHGFPDGAEGEVSVRLEQAGSRVTLCVNDNGKGLPPGVDAARPESLGLRLVGRLAERDLGGSLAVSSHAGARFEIEFPANAETEDGASA